MHDELSRRHFMARTAQACFGLTIGGAAADFFAPGAIAATPSRTAGGGGQAKSVIYVFLSALIRCMGFNSIVSPAG